MKKLTDAFRNTLQIDPSKPNLSDLPVEILEKIVKEANLPTRLTLRKVSQTLRTLVDKQDPFYDSIAIKVTSQCIKLNLEGRRITYDIVQGYRKQRKSIRSVMNEMFIDLKTFMSNPKFFVKNLKIEFNDDYSYDIFTECRSKHFSFDDAVESFVLIVHTRQNHFTVRDWFAFGPLESVEVHRITDEGDGTLKDRVTRMTQLEKLREGPGYVYGYKAGNDETYTEVYRKEAFRKSQKAIQNTKKWKPIGQRKPWNANF